MKKLVLTLSFLSFIIAAKAQSTDTAAGNNEKKVFVHIDKAPGYPSGTETFYKFLMKNLRYPAAARQNNTQGRVIVTMVVEKDGSLSDVKVSRGIGDGCDEE